MAQAAFKENYDVIIIGAGVGGLTAGALLAKAGLDVCVLEKEPHAGGYLAGYQRKNFRFDTAIHWLNQYKPGGIICRVFDALGPDYPKTECQNRIRRFIGPQHDYLLTNNPDQLKQQWQQEFPEDAKGIDEFFRRAKILGKAFDNFTPLLRSEETMTFWERLRHKRKMIGFGLKFLPYLGIKGPKGLQKGLSRYFKSPKLQAVFSGDTEILNCLVPIGWAYFNDFQSPPKGGGQVVPEWLLHHFRCYGQEAHFRWQVKEVITEKGKATGVICQQNSRTATLKSTYVIAACDTPTLFEKLLEPALIPARIKRNLKKADLYPSSLTVSIALDCPVEQLGFNEELVHLPPANGTPYTEGDGQPWTSELSILAPSFRDPSLAPAGCGTLVIYMPANINFENQWRTQLNDAGETVRGNAYHELKNSMATELIARVEKTIAPGLAGHILFFDVATPLTHWRYTGNTNGSMMGAKPGRSNMQNKVYGYKTPVDNLLIGGQWAELGGGVPIAVKAGANAALMVLKEEKPALFKTLCGYFDGEDTLQSIEKHPDFKPYPGNWTPGPTPAQKTKAHASSAENSIEQTPHFDQ